MPSICNNSQITYSNTDILLSGFSPTVHVCTWKCTELFRSSYNNALWQFSARRCFPGTLYWTSCNQILIDHFHRIKYRQRWKEITWQKLIHFTQRGGWEERVNKHLCVCTSMRLRAMVLTGRILHGPMSGRRAARSHARFSMCSVGSLRLFIALLSRCLALIFRFSKLRPANLSLSTFYSCKFSFSLNFLSLFLRSLLLSFAVKTTAFKRLLWIYFLLHACILKA